MLSYFSFSFSLSYVYHISYIYCCPLNSISFTSFDTWQHDHDLWASLYWSLSALVYPYIQFWLALVTSFVQSIPMASLRISCLVLLFTSILICQEARPLPFTFSRSNQSHAFSGSATKLVKELLLRKQLLGTENYEPNRLSPGGPDPLHH